MLLAYEVDTSSFPETLMPDISTAPFYIGECTDPPDEVREVMLYTSRAFLYNGRWWQPCGHPYLLVSSCGRVVRVRREPSWHSVSQYNDWYNAMPGHRRRRAIGLLRAVARDDTSAWLYLNRHFLQDISNPERLLHVSSCDIVFTADGRRGAARGEWMPSDYDVFYCSLSGHWFQYDEYEPVEVVETEELAMIDNAYYWESDGCYHDNYEPEPDDDDDDDVLRGNICGYHGGRRRDPITPYSIGVELEVDSDNRWELSLDVNCNFISPEEDGSLNDCTGVELVQIQAMPLADTISGWEHVFRLLDSQSGLTGYGMHVNICTRSWTERHEDCFIAFWHINEDFVRYFAKRRYNGWAACWGDDLPYVKRRAMEKYSACAKRSEDRCEVRIFRTTHVFSMFKARCQLVDAVARWCKTKRWNISELTNINTGRGSLLKFMERNKSRYADALRYTRAWIESTAVARVPAEDTQEVLLVCA